MRSRRGVVAALILLSGVALAFITGIVFGGGAENVLHFAMAVLATIFLLQGVSDLMHSASLQHLAYEVLGQRVELLLGYAFLLWCAAMLFWDSAGRTRVLGIVALRQSSLFIWLLLEGLRSRAASTTR